MPEQLSVADFVSLANEDLSSPGSSTFQAKMSDCRNTVSAIEEVRGGRGDENSTADKPQSLVSAGRRKSRR